MDPDEEGHGPVQPRPPAADDAGTVTADLSYVLSSIGPAKQEGSAGEQDLSRTGSQF